MTEKEIKFSKWIKIGLLSIGSLFVLATIALPIVGQNPDWLKPLFKDPFALANLEADVHWTGWEMFPGIFLAITILASVFYLKTEKRFLVLFIGTAIFINLTLYFSVGKIEQYSQRAAIEFFESKQEEDCYILPMGYKTYAHLWYGKRPKNLRKESRDFNWLMSDQVDKPVYIITKVHKLVHFEPYNNLVEVGRKNGFVFLKKEL